MSKFLLYEFSGEARDNLDPIEVLKFVPTIRKPFLSLLNETGKEKDYHNFWVELRWAIVTFFSYEIFYVITNNEIIHTSYCAKKCFKFPFMKSDDYHIGPCHTTTRARGQRVYPSVLTKIASEKYNNNHIYMVVEDTNLSSRHGVETAGFHVIGELQRSRFLKRYRIK